VIGGGVDDLLAMRGVDGHVVEVGVVMDEDRVHPFTGFLAGGCIRGLDLVADLERADRNRFAGRREH
jgi:hypothetical protein